ncbi:hypothetical protein ACIBCN_28640 [Nocardia sp. NPDC051052]|uniref:hypothetical protein n=1 Tax=Nocardia sp. NPDC051052 TaxID=3364322 RepID=UPI00379BA834
MSHARRLAELVTQHCQIVIATHSPLLLALPHATIYEIAEDGTIDDVTYDEALPVRLTRDFLAEPSRYLRHLVDGNDSAASLGNAGGTADIGPGHYPGR